MKPGGPCPKCGFFNCPGGEQCPAWEDKNTWDADDTIEEPKMKVFNLVPSQRMKDFEEVEIPKHYRQGKIEVIDFILDQKLGYCLGNAIKYICRCNHKGNKRTDLLKAIQYLNFELEKGGERCS